MLRGSYTEKLDRGSHSVLPTSLVFYSRHEPHSEAFGPQGGRAFNVELGGQWMTRMRDFGLREQDGPQEMRGSRLNWHATRLYGWFLSTGNGLGAEELVVEMLAEMGSIQATGKERRAPSWLSRVRDQLHAGYERAIRITDLAHEAGVHPVHLARVFRVHHGCTVGKYVQGLRIEHACGALSESDASLSSIALETGFSDQAHFTHRFKELTGMSPGVYRKLVTN
ncbi:MAG TPA: hypothetical protein DCF71_10565 [Gemmatimonadetes bacterium]|nr:hypothetical protein [Gemmatimonadota bacterium]